MGHFLLGIGGDSASGKSTFAKGIIELFGKENVSSISLDDYHKYDRKERTKLRITALNPRANNLELIEKHLSFIKKGISFQKPFYDHKDGKLKGPVEYIPNRINIVEGLFPFYKTSFLSYFDMTIFIDPSFDVRVEWKLFRDVNERGHKREDVLRSIEKRQPDYKKYIEPQRRKAEIIVKIKHDALIAHYSKGSPYWIRLIQKITGEKLSHIALPLDLSLICSDKGEELYIEYRKIRYGKKRASVIELNGLISKEMLKYVKEEIIKIAGTNSKNFMKERDYFDEISLARYIIAWRVAERLKKMEVK